MSNSVIARSASVRRRVDRLVRRRGQLRHRGAVRGAGRRGPGPERGVSMRRLAILALALCAGCDFDAELADCIETGRCYAPDAGDAGGDAPDGGAADSGEDAGAP